MSEGIDDDAGFYILLIYLGVDYLRYLTNVLFRQGWIPPGSRHGSKPISFLHTSLFSLSSLRP